MGIPQTLVFHEWISSVPNQVSYSNRVKETVRKRDSTLRRDHCRRHNRRDTVSILDTTRPTVRVPMWAANRLRTFDSIQLGVQWTITFDGKQWSSNSLNGMFLSWSLWFDETRVITELVVKRTYLKWCLTIVIIIRDAASEVLAWFKGCKKTRSNKMVVRLIYVNIFF